MMRTGQKSLLQRFDEPTIPLALPARLLLGYLFLKMGLHKVEDPFAFLKLIDQYEVLPVSPGYYLNITALVIPWLEVVCGLGLILGVWMRGAALVQALMLAVFTPVVFLRAWNIHTTAGIPFFQVAFDCGCGSGVVIIWKKLLSNVGLFALAVLMTCSRSRKFTLAALFDRFAPGARLCARCGCDLGNRTADHCEWCQPITAPAASAAADAVA